MLAPQQRDVTAERRRIADEELSPRLLAGFRLSADGLPVTEYPKHNSFEEKKARKALARLVRDYMPGLAGELLALAIDRDTPSKIPGMKPTRRVVFESPARGKPSTWARDLLIVEHIRQQTSMFNTENKEGAALKSAEDRFGLKQGATHFLALNASLLAAIMLTQ